MNPSSWPGGDLFRVAFDLAPAGRLAVDADGRILLANRECERLLGYEAGALPGMTIDDLVPERYRGRHAGHRRGFFVEPATRGMGAGRDLFALILATASGAPSKSELHGLGDNEFVPWQLGAVM